MLEGNKQSSNTEIGAPCLDNVIRICWKFDLEATTAESGLGRWGQGAGRKEGLCVCTRAHACVCVRACTHTHTHAYTLWEEYTCTGNTKAQGRRVVRRHGGV